MSSEMPYDEPIGAVWHLRDVRNELDRSESKKRNGLAFHITEEQVRALVWIIDHTTGLEEDSDLAQYLIHRAPYLDDRRRRATHG
jgi:hypothetical protein